MSFLLFIYVPTKGAHKVYITMTTLIVINSTKVEFSNAITLNHRNKGLEEFIEFLKYDSLKYAHAPTMTYSS